MASTSLSTTARLPADSAPAPVQTRPTVREQASAEAATLTSFSPPSLSLRNHRTDSDHCLRGSSTPAGHAPTEHLPRARAPFLVLAANFTPSSLYIQPNR